MGTATTGEEDKQARIMLGLLDSVERNGAQSQRRLAGELGIALGLVNAYLKRCVKKGLVKASQAPARRYVYYLTPQGFAEKSRLTVEFLSGSFGFFRQARNDCTALFADARAAGYEACHDRDRAARCDFPSHGFSLAHRCRRDRRATTRRLIKHMDIVLSILGLRFCRPGLT